MKLFRSLFSRSLKIRSRINHRRYRLRARLTASLHKGTIAWPKCVQASVPVRCDGKGSVTLGTGVRLGFLPAPRMGNGEILLQARNKTSVIKIGTGTATSNNVNIIAIDSIEIGKNCLIGDMVAIYDSDFHRIDPAERWNGSEPPAPVKVGDNVWVGSRTMILKGVTIGSNSVIGAGSIVTKSIPADVVASGVPAKVLRSI